MDDRPDHSGQWRLHHEVSPSAGGTTAGHPRQRGRCPIRFRTSSAASLRAFAATAARPATGGWAGLTGGFWTIRTAAAWCGVHGFRQAALRATSEVAVPIGNINHDRDNPGGLGFGGPAVPAWGSHWQGRVRRAAQRQVAADLVRGPDHRRPMRARIRARCRRHRDRRGAWRRRLTRAARSAGLLVAVPGDWFSHDPGFDRDFRTRYLTCNERARGRARWITGKAGRAGRAGALILFDQFPRNAFRAARRMRPTRRRAASRGIGMDRDFIAALPEPLRDVPGCCPFPIPRTPPTTICPSRCTNAFCLAAGRARRHCDIIRRFGRFPHRNGDPGRASTPAERDYLANGGVRLDLPQIQCATTGCRNMTDHSTRAACCATTARRERPASPTWSCSSTSSMFTIVQLSHYLIGTRNLAGAL